MSVPWCEAEIDVGVVVVGVVDVGVVGVVEVDVGAVGGVTGAVGGTGTVRVRPRSRAIVVLKEFSWADHIRWRLEYRYRHDSSQRMHLEYRPLARPSSPNGLTASAVVTQRAYHFSNGVDFWIGCDFYEACSGDRSHFRRW